MSYTGTQVYLPPERTPGSVASWIASKLPGARVLTAPGSAIRVQLQGADVRVALDNAETVRVEAKELAERAPANTRAALRRATWRLEVVPSNPRVDPDDVYNQLLVVFEAVREIPNGVGLDPFDGTFYFNEAAATGGAAPAPVEIEKPVAREAAKMPVPTKVAAKPKKAGARASAAKPKKAGARASAAKPKKASPVRASARPKKASPKKAGARQASVNKTRGAAAKVKAREASAKSSKTRARKRA